MGVDREAIASSCASLNLIDALYEQYCRDATAVDPSWQRFFEQLEQAAPQPVGDVVEGGEQRIYRLIQAYRTYGHLLANLNPIKVGEQEEPWQLNLERQGFSESESSHLFPTLGLLPENRAPLQAIVGVLREIYGGAVGVEYMGLQNPRLERWLQERIEPSRFKVALSVDEKRQILQQLNRSELFEHFIHTKYTGQKRFSIEGGETLIPVLAALVEKGARLGVEEVVLGMAHRGRLNVLCNILDKSYSEIFSEFEEGFVPLSVEGSGDVKYHKGFTSDVVTQSGKRVAVVLVPNPSHLEAVDAVVEGYARARQVARCDAFSGERVVPILVHGDAAVAGQGVVYETLQLFNLKGYTTGGTIHIVVNNQIGFTTFPQEGRSTRYCTDIARAFYAPVFHVNAEDPEACIFVAHLALELRQQFHCDVFIDLNCYRKYGHNEADEPAFTQPIEYQIIRNKRPIRELYRDQLIREGAVEKQIATDLEEEFKKALQKELSAVKISKKKGGTAPSKRPDPFSASKTGVQKKKLQELGERLCHIPEGLAVHRTLKKLLDSRLEMARGEKPIDWGMGELLAYASLLDEGVAIRVAGQDCCRGTFSHRHAIWMDQESESGYCPLKHLGKEQGRFDIYNSPLSEYACLGFEYGYSIAAPGSLVIWEAQFGDFANGAQVVIDQFIASAEQKWGQKSNLTLFLPHGYEGQGPEHSSARIERFLTLAAENNMQIVNPTTPAQLFHLLRRQSHRAFGSPLIVLTPKVLLRYPPCSSPLADFTKGGFQEILDDPSPPKKAKALLFCSGKIYYRLDSLRKERRLEDVGLVRVEQLYPLHTELLTKIVEKHRGVKRFFWVQEESKNGGAWSFIAPHLSSLLGKELIYVGRSESASPAVGSHALHKQEEEQLIQTLVEGIK